MLTSIRLQNFRSYKDGSFEFEPGVNIVVGPNASGKTNLLEAVLVLCRGKSYKAKDSELIRSGKQWARVDGMFEDQPRSVKIEQEGSSASKEFNLNGRTFKRLGLERTVPVVLFEPNHLYLISRGPEYRRDFIDDILQRTNPEVKHTIAQYKRTLSQRNSLLKQSPSSARQQLFVWNLRLSELGAKIASARNDLINEINKFISPTYSKIAHKKATVSLKYDSQFPINQYASKLLSKLEAHTALDFERGFTAYGPHREDIIFYLDGSLASASASRGETRSIVLALKIFELQLIEKHTGQKPILLLDDVFSELDVNRRRALVKYLKDHQVLITTTDADAVLEYFASGDHKLIPLN